MIRTATARVTSLSIVVAIGLVYGALSLSAEPEGKRERQEALNLARQSLLAQMHVDRWHAAGMRGRGIKVAILDSGFRDYREQLGTALPAKVTVRSFRHDRNLEARNSNHGVICAEIVHAIAPEAELLFANWEQDDPETFIEAVAWCHEHGARITSCSVITPCWSDGEGGGAVHERLAQIIGTGGKPDDILAFACAGNLAQRHWSGKFVGDRQGRHVWHERHVENTLSPWGSEPVSIEMCWKPGADYALEVLDNATRKRVGRMQRYTGPDRCTTCVRFDPEANHTYSIVVRLMGGTPGVFHLAALASWLECNDRPGSVPFPGDGLEWLAVGAVYEDGRRPAYSSCGPITGRLKPDLVGLVPFPTGIRSTPFSGTSAAAPQAAALAALIWSRRREMSARSIRELMCRSCIDVGPPGPDSESGFGRIQLPALDP